MSIYLCFQKSKSISYDESNYMGNYPEMVGKMFRKNEKQNIVSKEEKPVQSTQRLKDFLYKRFDFRYNRLTGVTEYRE